MEIKDGSHFDIVRDGVTFTIEAYVDMEGDGPWGLVVEVTHNGEDLMHTSDAMWEAFELEDWPTYVEELIKANLPHMKKGP